MRRLLRIVTTLALAVGVGGAARAQTEPPQTDPAPSAKADAKKPGPRMEIYGFAQLDMIEDFASVNPDWADTLRPTKLEAYDGQYGSGSHFYASVKQSRLGVKAWVPTGWGELETCVDFDFFGVGADAGQTTIRLRHAYAQLGHFLAGQAESVFMDLDVFPNQLDYWGPNGMVFFRNVQFRYMPLMGATRVWIALERPGSSGDGGVYSDRLAIQNIKPRNPLPDLTAQVRNTGDWGHVQFAGLVREIAWSDTLPDPYDLNGSVVGWGLTLSSVLNVTKNDALRLQAVYGQGCENYMNDAPVDVAIENNFGDPKKPIRGKAVPMWSLVAFLDHNWSPKLSTAIGYSRLTIDNTTGQTPDAFHVGQYALANLLWTPVKNVMAGVEGLWGYRKNYSDGFSTNDWRIQVSVKGSFSWTLGGK
ncbi:MAG TPA: DcaP family trimeric outer membrane transporter [Thermoanaerobaculia bacterium]|nr:DcaP family trimeric outer membrane transporter [Thermoanaerobaculia bacterium]HQR66632.1 DcaP family trimeric outer membrane transporter [Thermoanaerobaculia bacterium]